MNAQWLGDILLGNLEALRQIQYGRYTTFSLQDPFAPAPHLVSNLLGKRGRFHVAASLRTEHHLSRLRPSLHSDFLSRFLATLSSSALCPVFVAVCFGLLFLNGLSEVEGTCRRLLILSRAGSGLSKAPCEP